MRRRSNSWKKINLSVKSTSQNSKTSSNSRSRLSQTKQEVWLKTSKNIKMFKNNKKLFLPPKSLLLPPKVSCATSDTKWVFWATKSFTRKKCSTLIKARLKPLNKSLSSQSKHFKRILTCISMIGGWKSNKKLSTKKRGKSTRTNKTKNQARPQLTSQQVYQNLCWTCLKSRIKTIKRSTPNMSVTQTNPCRVALTATRSRMTGWTTRLKQVAKFYSHWAMSWITPNVSKTYLSTSWIGMRLT